MKYILYVVKSISYENIFHIFENKYCMKYASHTHIISLCNELVTVYTELSSSAPDGRELAF